jgi:uncharacterized membrane protein YidH (DUF202 family)
LKIYKKHTKAKQKQKMIVTLSSFPFMIDKSPFSLRNILSTRAVFSKMVEKISSEMVSENIVVNEINKLDYNHHIDIITVTIIAVGLLSIAINAYNSSQTQTQTQRLEKIEMFSRIQRTTSTFLFVFMLIFTKNIDSAT